MKLWIILLAVWMHQQFPLPVRQLLLQIIEAQWQRLSTAVHQRGRPLIIPVLLSSVLPLLVYSWLLYRVYGLTWGVWYDILSLLTVVLWIRLPTSEDWMGDWAVRTSSAEPNAPLLRSCRSWLHGLIAPLFWYILLGPLALMIYGLCVLATDSEDAPPLILLQQVMVWLDWLPGRILVLGMAMMNDFVSGMPIIKPRLLLAEDSIYLMHDLVAEAQLRTEPVLTEHGAGRWYAWVRRVNFLGLVVLALATVYAL